MVLYCGLLRVVYCVFSSCCFDNVEVLVWLGFVLCCALVFVLLGLRLGCSAGLMCLFSCCFTWFGILLAGLFCLGLGSYCWTLILIINVIN